MEIKKLGGWMPKFKQIPIKILMIFLSEVAFDPQAFQGLHVFENNSLTAPDHT